MDFLRFGPWQIAVAMLVIAIAIFVVDRYDLFSRSRPSENDLAPRLPSVLHVVKADRAASGVSPLTTPALDTPSAGALILVHVLTQPTATLQRLADNKGNVYVAVGGSRSYARNNIAGSHLFVAENGVGGPGHTWSLTKTPGHDKDEATIFVVVFPANTTPAALGAWSYRNSGRVRGAPLTTTAPDSSVVSFFGAADYSGTINDYTPPASWTRLDQVPFSNEHNSGANAVVTVPTPGTVVDPRWKTAHWIETGSSLWLVEVTSMGGRQSSPFHDNHTKAISRP